MLEAVNQRRVGRPPRNLRRMSVWLPQESWARMDALLREKELRADLIRAAVERELQRREAEKKRSK